MVYSTFKKNQSFGSNWQRYFSPPILKTEKTFGYISGNIPEKFNIPFFCAKSYCVCHQAAFQFIH